VSYISAGERHYINGTLYVNRILCNAPKSFLKREWRPGRALITFHKLAKLILFIATIIATFHCDYPQQLAIATIHNNYQ
jgi:hypothetical protein